ncbi:MAG: glycosyltransferase family 2 protein [Aeromicrobium sp.]|uniref:glycosyltransferase family 2 protein n=1 Tax=Aeromicrobium sp. TaxID=1871063 RepID=UPI0039E3640D
MKTVSYVFPIFNEEGNIPVLYDTLLRTIEPIAARYAFEFVFVNDGSVDGSLDLLEELRAADDRIVVVNFARNFGHQIAVTAGMENAVGDAVIIMDSDLQDPPAVSLELIERWEEGYDVAYAQRRSRQDSAFKKATASAYYRMLSRVAEVEIPRNTGDFRLLSRRVVDVLKRYPEHNRFVRGMVASLGFRQVAVEFDRHDRHAGETGYPLRKMLKLAGDGIIGFSTFPLRVITRLGFLFAALSIVGAMYVAGARLFGLGSAVAGWTFLVVVVFFVSAVQLIVLGVLGSYIGRVYTEVQGRPLYIVESVRSAREHPSEQ